MTVEEKIEQFAPVAEMMPGVVIIHSLKDFSPLFLTSKGLGLLNMDLDCLKAIGKDYTRQILNGEDMQPFLQKLRRLLDQNDPEQTIAFFHQVKHFGQEEWAWYLSSIKIFHQDKNGRPTHTVAISFPIDHIEKAKLYAERLLAEAAFTRENMSKYLNLGKRAKEVLRLVALGKTSGEIAEELNISIETVNSHRKNIKQKLGISSTYEVTEYALAFDLI